MFTKNIKIYYVRLYKRMHDRVIACTIACMIAWSFCSNFFMKTDKRNRSYKKTSYCRGKKSIFNKKIFILLDKVTNITCVTTSWVIVTDWSYSIDLARPKSHIFKRQFEFTKRFPGFRSLYWCFKFFPKFEKKVFKIMRCSVKNL